MNFWDLFSDRKRLAKLESNMATALEKIAALKAAISAESTQVDGLVAAFKALKVEVAELKQAVTDGVNVTEAFADIDEMIAQVEAIYTPGEEEEPAPVE
jgi:capsule polysaccharide export protein KpsE/RkpR